MVYTTPTVFEDNVLVDADDMNAIQDNIKALKDPPTAHYELDEASDYSSASQSFVDVDGTNLALEIETTGGDILVGFTGSVGFGGTSGRICLNLYESPDINGDVAGDDGILSVHCGPTLPYNGSFTYLLTGMSAGTHTIKLRYKSDVVGYGAKIWAGAGSDSGRDTHSQFWAREI